MTDAIPHVMPRAEAAARIGGHYANRDAYLIIAGPGEITTAMTRLGAVPGCACYLDNGTDDILALTGPAVAVLPVVMELLPPESMAGVLTVPKTVSADRLSTALGQEIPADQSRDVVMLMAQDGKHLSWPMFFVEALDEVDPAAAARIRADDTSQPREPSPAAVALLDQADAAGAQGMAGFHALAEHIGGEVVLETPGKIQKAILGQLFDRADSGKLTLCPHLNPASPEPSFWLPYAPGRIRCAECNVAAGRRITGTAEDNCCDYCRETSAEIFNVAGQLPPIVADLPGCLAALGPLTIMFGLCPDCHSRITAP
jgi:hypothetical protein